MSAAADIDQVTLQIAWNRIISTVDEAATALERASVSVIISEVHDFSVALLDESGESIAFSSKSISLFNGSFGITAKAVLERFPLAEMKPGDTFICNDPWITSGHLPDVFLCSPVFVDGRPVGLAASIGHVTDIGGTLRKFSTTSVYEEGLRIPPVKMIDGGEENTTLVDLLRYNSRAADEVLSDLYAQVGAHTIIQRRVSEMVADLGVDLATIRDGIFRRSEDAMRQVISQLAPGEYVVEEMSDGYIEPMLMRLTLKVPGDGTVILDYHGSAPASPDGSINAPWASTYSEGVAMVHSILLPEIPGNAGAFRPISVVTEPGSMFDAPAPFAVNTRTRPVFRADVLILRAFAECAPDKSTAAPGLPGGYFTYGTEDDGEYVTYLMISGGLGASGDGPGASCRWFPGSVAATGAEVLESHSPLLVETKRIRRGSGGDGRHRGGDGQEIVLSLDAAHPHKATVLMHPQMLGFPAMGVAGGEPGALGRVERNGEVIDRRALAVLGGNVELQPGDKVSIRTPGGGGWGAAR